MNRPNFRTWATIGVLGFGALGTLAACNDKVFTAPPAGSIKPNPDPNFASGVPFNNQGACLAADAFNSDFTSGVNSVTTLADPTRGLRVDDVESRGPTSSRSRSTGLPFHAVHRQAGDLAVRTPIFRGGDPRAPPRGDRHVGAAPTSVSRGRPEQQRRRPGRAEHYRPRISRYHRHNRGRRLEDIDGDQCGDMNAGASTARRSSWVSSMPFAKALAGSDLLTLARAWRGQCPAATSRARRTACSLPTATDLGRLPARSRSATAPGSTCRSQSSGRRTSH